MQGPSAGSRTTGVAALNEAGRFLGVEVAGEYITIAPDRLGAADGRPVSTTFAPAKRLSSRSTATVRTASRDSLIEACIDPAAADD